jgi:uncharacterized protein YPO0396
MGRRRDYPTTPRGTSIAAVLVMPTDLEQLLKDLFGDSLNRLNQFQMDQVKRLQAKLQEIAHDALKDELAKIHAELNTLRERVTALEAERAEAAAESLESSF